MSNMTGATMVEQRLVEARCSAVNQAMHDISAALALIQRSATAIKAATGYSGAHVFVPLSAFFNNPLYREGESFAELEASIHKAMLTAGWESLIEGINMKALMTDSQFEQMRADNRKDPQPLTPDAVQQSLWTLVTEHHSIALQGLVGTFEALGHAFKSHSSWQFNRRSIIKDVCSAGWDGRLSLQSNSSGTRRLNDLERGLMFALNPELRATKRLTALDALREHLAGPEPYSVLELPYFSLKAFKNGNCHVSFDDERVLERINGLLSKHYGAVLADDSGKNRGRRARR